MFAVDDHDAGEAQIDGGREKSGANGQADKIPERDESITDVWSMVELLTSRKWFS